MDNIKSFMGSAYHEGVTVEEINTFLSGKKFVDLHEGNYVAKDKFESTKSELEALKESTKDFDTIKTEYENLKAEKTETAIKDKLIKAGISEKALKYVKGDLADGTLKNSDDEKEFKANVATYLKANPQFASKAEPSNNPKRVIATHIDNDGHDDHPTNGVNSQINNAIRQACGQKITVDDDVNV